MIDNGVVAEARKAWTIYPENHEALTGNIYQSLIPYLNQEVGLEDVRQDFINRDLKLAKKQITWFKRNKQIVWFDNNVEALDYLKTPNLEQDCPKLGDNQPNYQHQCPKIGDCLPKSTGLERIILENCSCWLANTVSTSSVYT